MIKEVIVVEGKHDTDAIRRAVEADTIETGGSAVNADVIRRIALAQKRRGVIIFTDPDHAGERIRKLISERVKGCKHAFLAQEEATYKEDIGIENARPEAIRTALQSVRTELQGAQSDLAWGDVIGLGLTGTDRAAERRLALGKKLRIGYANGKTFYKRCLMFGITRAELLEAADACGLLGEAGAEADNEHKGEQE